MGWIITDSEIMTQEITAASDTQRHALGREFVAQHPTYGSGTFVYAKGVADCVLGDAVLFNAKDGSIERLVPNSNGPVGWAMAALVAGKYGFIQRVGTTVGKVAADFADNGRVWATATPGTVDDAVVDGDLVHNAKGATAIGTPSAGYALLEIDRPYMDDIASND